MAEQGHASTLPDTLLILMGVSTRSAVTVRAMTDQDRFCRTPDEAFQAGWDEAAAADLPPLTQSQIERLVAIHKPYLLPKNENNEVDA